MTEYMRELKKRRQLEQTKNSSFCGQLGGVLLIGYGLSGWLKCDREWDILFLGLTAAGAVMLLLGLLIPDVLNGPCKIFMCFGNTIGKIVFSLLLAVVYVVIVFPASLVWRKKRAEFGFADSGELSRDTGLKQGFGAWDYEGSQRTGGILRVFGYFVDRKDYLLLPLIVILVGIGIVLFFVSSSVAAPFIYTLF